MSKEAPKVQETTKQPMNRVKPEQRKATLEGFKTIAGDDKVLYNKMVESYDANNLVVGTRIDNWLEISKLSPEAKALIKNINRDFASLNAVIEKENMLLHKKGHDVLGVPRCSHKVEIIIPTDA